MPTFGDLKPKDLVGIPWMVAFALRADGWYLRSDIIWAKPNPMPESVTDRPTKSHEYLFLLAKSQTYYFDQEAVRESGIAGSEASLSAVRGGQGSEGGISRHTRGQSEGESEGASLLLHGQGQGGAEALLVQRQGESELSPWRPQTPSTNGDRVDPDGFGVGRNQSGPTSTLSLLWGENHPDNGPPHPALEGRAAYGGERGGSLSELQQLEGQSVGRNIRSVWTVATQPYPGAHFATFPPKLIEPCIKAGTSERGVCVECGASWERVVERENNWQERRAAGAWAGNVGVSDTYQNGVHGKGMTHDLGGGRVVEKGWQPSCRHDAPTKPAVVLDPFGGSGTTAVVANGLSRRAILIDLNPEYIEQQLRRNQQTPMGLVG
jgi:hypothetical protein